MIWLFAAVLSYALFGLAALADRYLLAGPLPHPRVYAFYAGITGAFAVFLIPLGLAEYTIGGATLPQLFEFRVPSADYAALALIAGAVNILSLYLFYRALLRGNVSTVVPMMGAVGPLVTLGLGALVLNERFDLTPQLGGSFALLVVGTVFLALHSVPGRFVFSARDMGNAAVAGIFFGAGFTLTKLVFNAEGFWNGFIWMAFGGFALSLLLLVMPGTRQIIFHKNPVAKSRVWLPFAIGKGAGSAGAILQNVAIYLALPVEVAFISALSGLQYFFILIFVAVMALRDPRLLKEELNVSSFSMRLAGVLLISAGLALIFLQ